MGCKHPILPTDKRSAILSIMRISDGLSNVVTGIGTDRSKSYSTTYTAPVQQDQVYINAFRCSKLARRVVEQPAKDAFRKWRAWQSASDAQISAIEATERRLDVRGKLEQCMMLARLLGKAYLYISIKGDEDRTEEPLNPERIRRDAINHITVLTKSEVAEGLVDINSLSPTYGQPEYYEITGASSLVRVHPTRLVIFYGAERPYEFLQGRDADSVLMSTLPAIARHELMVDTVADLMQEACVDVITVPDLWNMMQDAEGEALVIRRFTEMKRLKSNNRVTLLHGSASPDVPTEEWNTKQISFATLPDVIETDQKELCAVAEMPHALLFGSSAGGLGSTGDMELSNYYDRINTIQSNDIQPSIHILDECIIRSSLGSRPPDIHYAWESLWQMSDKEKAEIGKLIADKWNVAIQAGLPPDAAIPSLVNDLTESGVGGGVEKNYEEWFNAGGELDPAQDDQDDMEADDGDDTATS